MNKRPTILLISAYYKEPHRWISSTQMLSKLWATMGYNVFILAMANTSDGRPYEEEKISEYITLGKVQDFFLKDPWNYGIAFRFFPIVQKQYRRLQPNYIIVDKVLFWTSISVILLRIQGCTVHLITDAFVGITWFTKSWLFNVCARIYANTLGWLIMLCANTVTTFHPQPQQVLKRLMIAQKTSTIPYGINTSNYYSKQSSNSITISYVGRLESVKRVDDFLAATTALQATHPNLRIQVVGKYNDDNPLYVQYCETVDFLGYRTDVPDILATTDIFVLPSYCEGLPGALMEAMASGCACVCSNVGGIPYLLTHNQTGLLYESGNTIALQAHLQTLLDNTKKRERLGQAAKQRITAFDWKTVGKQWQGFFELHTTAKH